MKTSDLLIELKAIDPRLDIVINPNRPGLSNVKLDGKDIIPVPSEEIRENPDPMYTYTFPGGMMARHKSRSEVLDAVKNVLDIIKTPEGNELFFSND